MHGPGRFRPARFLPFCGVPLAACCLLLAGCSGASTPLPGRTTTPPLPSTDASVPAGSASATGTSTTPGTGSTVPRLTVAGYGPLRFGMTKAQAAAALGAPITGDGGTGDDFCLLGHSAAAPGLTLAVVQGTVRAAAGDGEAAPSAVVTQEGVRIGTPLADLLKLLPVTVTTRRYTSGPNTTEYDVTVGPGAAESFLVDDTSRRVTSFSYGDPAYVVGTEFLCL